MNVAENMRTFNGPNGRTSSNVNLNVHRRSTHLDLENNHRPNQQLADMLADCKLRMNASIAQLCQAKDAIQADLDVILQDRTVALQQRVDAQVQCARRWTDAVEQRITTESARVRNEADTAALLHDKSVALQRQARWIDNEMNNTRDATQALVTETTHWKTLANAQQHDMECARAQSVQNVQKLQHTISLYATTTGIKWDYLQQEQLFERGQGLYLVGEVNVPSEGTIRRFQIDREANSRYDIAAQLWGIMDGGGGSHGRNDEEDGNDMA